MGMIESDSQSFIVKVWVEDSAQAGSQGVWHGSITHVPSGQRQYLKNLDEIREFILPYLESMGVKPGTRWRMKLWLKRWIGHNRKQPTSSQE